ncbi:flavodoxin domain-containing protein, partial [Devosia sp.]|uniref:flavodoxin domain-containing protein n=1 Tax=Devosia sp. TaxID=1871048 RepID=UPI003A8D4BCD
FAAARGSVWSRLHVEMSRIAVVALMLSALTGLYMALVSFGLVTDGAPGFGSFPPAGSGDTPAAIAQLAGLQGIPVSDLRELIFPIAGDPTDVFSVTTANGVGYVDAASGEMISFTANNLAQSIYETVYMLHTGNGSWSLGLILGIAALLVPVLALSGTVTWWRRSRSRPQIASNVGARHAEAVIMVGSESNATWGFAAELHRALTAAGRTVHTGPMNGLASGYPRAKQMFILTSTHGDGKAPESASRFLSRLARWHQTPRFSYAVLGFGDHSFQHFSAFGALVDETLAQKGWDRLLPATHIDRQSAHAFASWGQRLGEMLDLPLTLHHVPERPQTSPLEVVGRVDYGVEIQAPTSVLRLQAPEGARLPKYAAGDLLGIVPPGSLVPRYYSLASGSRDGFLEICVRKQSGGVCSEFLHALEPGDVVDGFVRANPDFRPARGRRPVVMIGNGTGIAPFVGFIWSNRKRRPMHLYWGGRNPDSDFLYGNTLATCLEDHRLATRSLAFSRSQGPTYVQDRVREDGDRLRALAAAGAQFLICGSREMAEGVKDALDLVLGPAGGSVDGLKAKGRYLEDVY